MGRFLVSSVVGGALWFATTSGLWARLSLVRDHQPQAVICLPEESVGAVAMAARELQTYFQKISGAELPIVKEKPESGAWILLRVQSDPGGDPLQQDAFTIDVTAEGVTITGHSEIAVLYGAYQLLNNLGVSWFSPGEIGENIPKRADISLKFGSDTQKPSFRTRVIDYSGTDDWHFGGDNQERLHQEFDLWLLRNKLQFSRMIHTRSKYHLPDFGWAREFSYHNLRNAALGKDWKTNKELDRERLALVTENKVSERRTEKAQICFTHPKNIETAIQSAIDYFKEFPERMTFPLSPDDHDGFCECERCFQANGGISPATDPNRVVWKFMNAVAKGLGEKMPGKRIAFYATYQLMTHPPYEVLAEPNLVALTCHVTSQARPIADPSEPHNAAYLEHIRLVGTSGAELGAYDYFLFPGNPQPLALIEDVKVYHKLGYVWYSAEWMGRDEQRNIVAWVLAQLAWNPDQDPRALLESFCHQYYGKAGPTVIRWLDLIESRVRTMQRITFGHISLVPFLLTPDVVKQGRALFEEAESQVSGREAERVQRLRLTFESWHRAAEVARLYKKALLDRSEAAKQAVLDEVESFTHFWDDNHLSEICSPRLLDHYIKQYPKKVKRIQPRIEATGSQDLHGGNRTVAIQAMFLNAEADTPTILRESEKSGVPQTISHISLLPEMWKFQIAPEDPPITNAEESSAELPLPSKPEFDDSRWPELSIFNTFDDQGFPDYYGVFWYRLTFNAPLFPEETRIWLRIGALDDDGEIYLNGKLVEKRTGIRSSDWKTSFAFDVTDTLRQGRQNVIAIRGLNVFGAGGLWRPVGLYARSDPE